MAKPLSELLRHMSPESIDRARELARKLSVTVHTIDLAESPEAPPPDIKKDSHLK